MAKDDLQKVLNTTDGTEAKRLYAEEKTRRKSGNISFDKRLNKLKGSLQEFLELEADPILPEGGLLYPGKRR